MGKKDLEIVARARDGMLTIFDRKSNTVNRYERVGEEEFAKLIFLLDDNRFDEAQAILVNYPVSKVMEIQNK